LLFAEDRIMVRHFLRYLIAKITVTDAHVEVEARGGAALKLLAASGVPGGGVHPQASVLTTDSDWLPRVIAPPTWVSGRSPETFGEPKPRLGPFNSSNWINLLDRPMSSANGIAWGRPVSGDTSPPPVRQGCRRAPGLPPRARAAAAARQGRRRAPGPPPRQAAAAARRQITGEPGDLLTLAFFGYRPTRAARFPAAVLIENPTLEAARRTILPKFTPRPTRSPRSHEASLRRTARLRTMRTGSGGISMIRKTLARPVEGVLALVVYLAQVAFVIGRAAAQQGASATAWCFEEEGRALFKGLIAVAAAIIVLSQGAWLLEGIKSMWDHDRPTMFRLVVGLLKTAGGIAAVGAAVLGIAFLVVSVTVCLAVVPVFTLVEVIRALARGLKVAVHAAACAKIAQVPPDAPDASASAVLYHVSDLHIAAPKQMPYELEVDDGHWPLETKPTSERLRARLTHILTRAIQAGPCPIVVTGDITDTGAQCEWDAVVATLMPFAARLVLAPGNHDISINRSTEPDYRQNKRAARCQRFAEALTQLSELPAKPYDELFPACRPLAEGATLFVLDSNRYASRYVLSNAVGMHGAEQLNKLEAMLASAKGPIVVATHHHVARLAGERFTFEDAYMIAIDGKRLLAILAGYRSKDQSNAVLLIHGHRHVSMYGRHASGILIYGHPSSTLGQSSNGQLDAVGRYASVHLSRNREQREWYVATHQVEAVLSDDAQLDVGHLAEDARAVVTHLVNTELPN
jgi:hypothetical protein